jgi:hypothetical protein
MDLANNDRRGAESLKGPEPAVNRSLHLTDTMSQDDEKVDNDWDHQSREYSEPLRTTERPPADDESNMFMSDPSFSEGGDSSVSGHVRARHRYGPPPPIIAQPSPVPSSPGNTSLSSWDSPAINNRVLLHFTPDRTNVRRKKSSSGNVVSDSSHENSSQSRQPPPLPSMNTSDHQQQRTLDGASNTSRAPSFDGHRLHALGNFIDHLRHRSTGALRNSPPSAPGGSVPGAAPSQVSAVMRSGAVSSDNTQQGAVATDPRSPQSSINESLRAGDISIAMTLSDSENEGDQTLALFGTAHTDDGDDEADWEAEKSAEDVNTAKRLPRLSPRLRVHAAGKSSSTGHGHGRTRSGDGAAAALATGGKDWKGMEQDRIPIPVENCSGDEDEDDDDGDSNRGIFTMQSRRRDRVSQSREDKNKPEGASLSTHVSPSASLRNPSHSSLPPTHVSPGASLRNPSQSSLPPIHVSPGASLRNPSHSSLPPTHVSPGASLRNPSHSSLPPEQEDRGWGENIRSSDSHRESLIYSQTSGETPGEYTGEENDSDSDSNDGEPRMSVLENRLPYPTDAHDLDDFERHFEDRQVRGAHQNIRRTSSPRRPSPFENIGKNSTEKANRKTFMPQSSVIGDDPKAYATYMCPRCRTVQREFFTVADAPRHVETASGYLALYFAIYVIASLFIFGLEEGWEPLDCIYFAVVTLTTAGLGDKVPTTDANKIICSIFIYFGVACIGLLLGSYIAGMLDDRAFRDAKTKQINSCPNCARLQTMRDAAKVGSRSSYSPTQPAPLRTNMKRHMSERIYGKPPQQQDHTALYVSGHHHKRGHSGSPRRIPVPKPERVSDRSNHSDQFELTPPFTDSEHVREGSGSYDSQNGSQGHASSYSSQQPSPNTMAMGSPMTRQILGRQSHTRHGSMDIRGNEFFGGGVKSGGAKTYGAIRTRGFSADVTSAQNPPPIGENEPFYGNNPMPKVPFVPGGYSGTGGVNDDDGDYISDADESIYSSSSSTSTEVLLDDTATKIRTAKYGTLTFNYEENKCFLAAVPFASCPGQSSLALVLSLFAVFLTLRQALVNSMVIIAVGCIGFWLIEGFSLVDSWYFTTVFLTTVGYGMYPYRSYMATRLSGMDVSNSFHWYISFLFRVYNCWLFHRRYCPSN